MANLIHPDDHVAIETCTGKRKKELPLCDFYKDMTKCKLCYTKGRACRTRLTADLPKEKIEELQAKSPDILEEVEKSFNAGWDKAKKDNRKCSSSA